MRVNNCQGLASREARDSKLVAGIEPNTSGLEARLSRDPGRTLGETEQRTGSCRTGGAAEMNSSGPIRVGQVPQG